ncbi:hypothetical protein J6590_010165 [Homalodisca vitripennis]|nr:hypothetical protein J6590_010165 [Homalodisca vitripennis]
MMSELLSRRLGHEYTVSAVVRPGAPLNYVVHDLPGMVKEFTTDDTVVIMGGANDIGKDSGLSLCDTMCCLQETWTDADTEALLHTVPGYRLVSCYSRSQQKAGGTAILAKSNLKTNSVKNMNRIKCIDGTFEYRFAEVLKGCN